MTESKRILLVLKEPRDGTQIILEMANDKEHEAFIKQANEHGLEHSLIGLEDFDPMTYRGSRYFDLRNPFTLKNFKLTDWLEFLEHWDKHERNDKPDENIV